MSERFWVVVAALVCGAVLLAARRVWHLRGAASRAAVPFNSHGAIAAKSSRHDGAGSVATSPASPPVRTEREPGEWTPVAFAYPQVEPYAEDVAHTKPVPYRPFKWGEYHVTMGIRSMPWDEWLELDEQFPLYHAIRERRIAERGDRLVRTLPENPGLVQGGREAAVELVHELAEYLCRKHPEMYHVVRHDPAKDTSGWYGEPSIKTITIVPLDKTYDLDEADPMAVSALLVQEDLALMIEGADGQLYLQAGAILIPGSWRLADKIGMHLDDIHLSGAVPQFEKKLQPSMTRFLRRMDVSKPVVRNNYTFQVVAPTAQADPRDPDELAWMRTMKGDEDAAHGDGPGGNFSADYSDLSSIAEPVDPARVRMRVERQTLRRLPRTGAILFTIRVYLTPLEQLVREPEVPGRMASAIRSWPEDVAKYKGRAAIESILDYLDENHDRQQTEKA